MRRDDMQQSHWTCDRCGEQDTTRMYAHSSKLNLHRVTLERRSANNELQHVEYDLCQDCFVDALANLMNGDDIEWVSTAIGPRVREHDPYAAEV